ncbi:putative peptidase M14, carboxypeptidase A, 1, 4-beta cellobiohydrolase [Plasmopara halstedii]
MTLTIHRARECEYVRIWAANATSTTSLSSLQQQDHATWMISDASAAFITNGVLELQNTSLRIAFPLETSATLHRFSMRTRIPQNGQTMIKAQLHGRTLAIGSIPQETASNEVFIGSSVGQTVAVQLPCITNVADAFLDVEFVWHDEWVRWFVNGAMLLEEFMPQDKEQNDKKVIMEFHVEANLSVELIELSSANATDPFCAPRYSTSSNCRTHESLTPRLGSISGSLSVEEVDAFIDQVAATFPQISRIENLGRSVEGRPLRALCLGACDAQDERKIPQALYTGMHHARESMVYTIDILILDYRNGDLAALELLTSRQLWFILIVNPDGYAHNVMGRVWENSEIGQRKSGAPTCDKSPKDAGVDLNRNYDICFARDKKGSSNEPCGDDYSGAKAFSEPETQAVRDLVERNTSDFSVALNYHSYGKYMNLPFACQAKGEPSAPNNTVFVALAREMAHYNGFAYGQSWKESNLYTVNGDASDWMWQAHGIFAISPEVGPEFDIAGEIGFWPPIDEVPHISSALHYSNFYIARMAGPVYLLDVKKVELRTVDGDGATSSFVYVDVVISNFGLRSETAEVLGSVFINGTSSSDPIHLHLKANPVGSEAMTEEKHTIKVPYAKINFHQPASEIKELYLVVRDVLSCQLFRVAVHFPTSISQSNQTSFQSWTPLPLPRCGTCELFGRADEDASMRNRSPVCLDVRDVTKLELLHTHIVTAVVISGIKDDNLTSNHPYPTASEHQGSTLSSYLPSSLSWLDLVAIASLLTLILVVVVVLVLRWQRRLGKNRMRAKPALGALKKRTNNVRYSRVDDDAASSPAATMSATRQTRDEKKIDLKAVDAECEKITSHEETEFLSTVRAKSPRRTLSPLHLTQLCGKYASANFDQVEHVNVEKVGRGHKSKKLVVWHSQGDQKILARYKFVRSELARSVSLNFSKPMGTVTHFATLLIASLSVSWSVTIAQLSPITCQPALSSSYLDAVAANPNLKDQIQLVAKHQVAQWYTDRVADYATLAKTVVLPKCDTKNASPPTVIVYGLPQKDCAGGYSTAGSNANTDDYRVFLQHLADATGDQHVIYILEPDAIGLLADAGCGNDKNYAANLGVAINTLSQNINAEMYLDVGYWTLANDEQAAAVAKIVSAVDPGSICKGIALNTANYRSTAEMVATCERFVNASDRNYKCIVDTSRNYVTVSKEWCNSKWAGIGEFPTNTTGSDVVSHFIWAKPAGESDGECTGQSDDALRGPKAGDFFLDSFVNLWDNGIFVQELGMTPINIGTTITNQSTSWLNLLPALTANESFNATSDDPAKAPELVQFESTPTAVVVDVALQDDHNNVHTVPDFLNIDTAIPEHKACN